MLCRKSSDGPSFAFESMGHSKGLGMKISKVAGNNLWSPLLALIAVTAMAAPPPSVPGAAAAVDVLKLQSVRLTFGENESGPNVVFVKPGQPIPDLYAHFRFSGTGTVAVRWEFVPPGDNYADGRALLPETQSRSDTSGDTGRRSVLDRGEILLPALGTYRLPGPNTRDIPRDTLGRSMIILRIESAESQGRSAKQSAIAIKGLQLYLQGPAGK